MAERLFGVELTANFLTCLNSIDAFLLEAAVPQAYDALLADLRGTVIPNLGRFPKMGRRYLDHPPQSAEALTALAALPRGAVNTLREYLNGDYLILYALAAEQRTVYLLSIRHHRQLAFGFHRVWTP